MRERAILKAREFALCVRGRLGEITAILCGSYARGDFNEWSDIDVLIITREELPKSPLERLDLILECLKKIPDVEPVVVTIGEFQKMIERRNPLAKEALERGIVLIDDIVILRQPPSISTPL